MDFSLEHPSFTLHSSLLSEPLIRTFPKLFHMHPLLSASQAAGTLGAVTVPHHSRFIPVLPQVSVIFS